MIPFDDAVMNHENMGKWTTWIHDNYLVKWMIHNLFVVCNCSNIASAMIVHILTLTHWGQDKVTDIFPDDLFIWIFLKENIWILIYNSLKFVPKGPLSEPTMDWFIDASNTSLAIDELTTNDG